MRRIGGFTRPRGGLGADRSGSVAVVFALSATAILGAAGAGMDYARLAARRGHLQAAADAGVLTAGNHMKLAMATQATVSGIAEQTIRAEAKAQTDGPLSVKVTVADDKMSVSAVVGETVALSFGGLVGMPTVPISVTSKASVVGKMRLCMLTLDPAAAGSFLLEKSAKVTATDCSLYANSSDRKSMMGEDSSYARGQTICTVGGYTGKRANFAPPPQTGCPKIEDPLKDRAAPPVEACRSIPASANRNGDVSRNKVDRDTTLDPGTYCGGLRLTDKAVVTLKPGVYVMKDGPFIVEKSASVTGTGVGFYFMGDRAGLVFDKKTTISLSAPVSGPMAGLLMMEQRNVENPVDPSGSLEADLGDLLAVLPLPLPPLAATKPMRTYRIISDNARTMLGTLYLPAGRVVIDASKPVADQSAYTVIVAQQVNLYEGPNLTLNANYDMSNVPVPKGVGPLSGQLLLTQ